MNRFCFLKLSIKVATILALITMFVFFLFACTNKQSKDQQSSAIMQPKLDRKSKSFSMVSIPDSITFPEDRANYLVSHYWDNFDFCDTTFIHLPEVTEQAFVDYLDALNYAQKNISSSIDNMLTRAAIEDGTGKMYTYFLDLFESYTYDPNSPMLNEELYIPVVKYIANDTISDEALKTRASFALKMMLKNRKGTIATNFRYVTNNGRKGSLYTLKNEYTLLYFYNPDCPYCKQTTTYMKESSILNHLLQIGDLDVLAVYPDDELNLWKEHAKELPGEWINAREEPRLIKSKQLYDLRAIPTLYLLDKDKNVLLKDANITTVEQFLNNRYVSVY